MKEIAEYSGTYTFRESVRLILDHGERSARRLLKQLPKGEYFAEDWMDDDGLSHDPIYVCVRVIIRDDAFIADFTGSSPQVTGPVNCTRTRLHSACRSMFKSITDPSSPVNDGWFRPIRVICPDRTVFTAGRPAAVSTYWETGAYAVDLLWHALSKNFPDRLTAGHFLSVCGTIISGKDEDDEPFILVEPQAGGWGAGADKDGESGLVPVGDGETYIMPVEVCEDRYPLLVERYAFNMQACGAGKHRGGYGLIREYRVLCEEAWLTTTFGRHKYPPWGAEGGHAGTINGVSIIPDGKESPEVWKGKLARYPLRRGDLVRLVTGTGGGYGFPMLRSPESVRNDVIHGLLSIEESESLYGVAVSKDTLKVDWDKTKKLRRR